MKITLSFHHKRILDDLINKSLNEILGNNTLLAVASIKDGGESWINTVYFAYNDKLILYFLTPPTAQHSKNIEKNNSVAISIFDSHQRVTGKKRGLQIFGICRRAREKEVKEGIRIYGKRFAAFAARVHSPNDFEKLKMESRIYVVIPRAIKIFDQVIFGEEKWVTVEVPG